MRWSWILRGGTNPRNGRFDTRRAGRYSSDGWKIERCDCGFMVTTMPAGRHECPRCQP